MADFGAQLREARERKGISLRQIAASTKISVAALEGLERNDTTRLPGGIFSRAFVRSYAIEVGLDPDETVRQFLQLFSGETPGAPSQPAPSAAHPRGGFPPARQRQAAARTASADQPESGNVTEEADFESKQRMASVVLKLALVSLPIAVAIVYFGSRASTVTTRGGSSTRPEASGSAQAGSEHDMTPATPSTPAEPEPEQAAVTGHEPRAATVAPTAASTPAAQAGTVRLEIAPTASCWVRLTIDGEVALSRVIESGEREARDFRDSAVLQVGDAAACAFSINGLAARPLGRPKQVREVRVTRENYQSFLP